MQHRSRLPAAPMIAVALTISAALLPVAARAQSVIDEWSSVKPPPPPELKSVTLDPKKTAMLVMDFNKGRCTPSQRPRCAAALPKIQKLLNEARQKGVVIVHTLSGPTKPEDISAELTPAPGEDVIRPGMDKFFENDMAKKFHDKGITHVILTGTSANGAVMFTAAGAVLRKFEVVVPVDGMPADSSYEEQFTAWNLRNGPNLRDHVTLTRFDMLRF